MLGQPDIPFRADGIRLMRYVAIDAARRAPQDCRQVQVLHRQQARRAGAIRTGVYARIERGHEA
ncbi:MAG: hypothetical protein AAF371_04965 [Pseudomonadota bacterium]